MKLHVALLLAYCLKLFTSFAVDACSFFPNYLCCSSSYLSTDFIKQYTTHLHYPEMKTELPKTLRILCFGDSLTAGYTQVNWHFPYHVKCSAMSNRGKWGLEWHPYADHLGTSLRSLLLTSDIDIDIDIDVRGLSGDEVVDGQYLSRIKACCQSPDNAAAKPKYDWIIIMGGTNDLSWGKQPDEIFEGLGEFCVISTFSRSPLRFNSIKKSRH